MSLTARRTSGGTGPPTFRAEVKCRVGEGSLIRPGSWTEAKAQDGPPGNLGDPAHVHVRASRQSGRRLNNDPGPEGTLRPSGSASASCETSRDLIEDQITPAQAPQDRPGQPGENAGDEERGEARVFTGGASFDHFMQMSQGQAALRQGPVHCIEAKRKNGLLRPAMGFHPLQPAAQLGNSGGRAGQGHPQDLPKNESLNSARMY
jgi:hypothetical protein